jgi:hypothetical protein
MVSSGMLRRVTLVRTDVSEELSASFIRVTRVGELGTTLAVTSILRSVRRLLVTASVVPSSLILVSLMKEALGSSETLVLTEPHGVTSQKTPFFIVKSYNYTLLYNLLSTYDWSNVYETTAVDTAVASLCAAVCGAMEQAISRAYSCRSKFPCWFSYTLRHYIAKKNCLHRSFIMKPSD